MLRWWLVLGMCHTGCQHGGWWLALISLYIWEDALTNRGFTLHLFMFTSSIRRLKMNYHHDAPWVSTCLFADVSVSCVTQMLVCPHTCLSHPHLMQCFKLFILTFSVFFFFFWIFPCPLLVLNVCLLFPRSLPPVSLQGLVGECNEGIGRD